jgi:hypothetical protein
MGAAYDLLGSGRTVLRFSLCKYLEGAGVTGTYANTNPTCGCLRTTSVFGTAGVTRAWTDANTNFVPDCDLLNPSAQDLRASGGDLCGVVSNTSFGQNVVTNAFDPRLLNGWGSVPRIGTSGSRFSSRSFREHRWRCRTRAAGITVFSVVDNQLLQTR